MSAQNTRHGLKIASEEGEIAKFKADIIVNSTNKELCLGRDRISRTLLEVAGNSIQEECTNNFSDGLNYGEIAMTGTHGGLMCKQVFHVALPPWDTPDLDVQQILQQTICECLQKAHEYNMASIAFPALGCGFLNYPMEIVTDTIHECVDQFNINHPESSLRQVTIVIEPKGEDWQHIKQAFRKSKAKTSEFRRSFANISHLKSIMCGSEFADNACDKTLQCGHRCLGYTNEYVCPPCLHKACGRSPFPRKDEDCAICYTDPLAAAPVVMLSCNHVFHLHCVRRLVENKWVGNRINFNFMDCPLCKLPMEHEELENYLGPYRPLRDDVRKKALSRLHYEGHDKCEAVTVPGSPFYGKQELYALTRYSYFQCFKCKKAYFGGEAECEAAGEGVEIDPSELVCPDCRDGGITKCPEHGEDFIEYKCRYCCSVALFYCFGTTHFCNDCHNAVDVVMDNPFIPCPAGPCREQLEGACPLGYKHPPTGEEFCLGCRLCPSDNLILARVNGATEQMEVD